VVVTGASGRVRRPVDSMRSAAPVQKASCGFWPELTDISRAQQRELRSSIGLVFQSHSLIDALTAGQNVMMSLLGRLPPRTRTGARRGVGPARPGESGDALPEELSGARSNVLPLPGRWSADLS